MSHNQNIASRPQLEEFVSYLRDELAHIKFSKDEYVIASQLLAERMLGIYGMKDTFIRLLPIDSRHDGISFANLLVNIVQDGFSRLAADAREGMEYELFLKRIEEERQIWFEQLRIS